MNEINIYLLLQAIKNDIKYKKNTKMLKLGCCLTSLCILINVVSFICLLFTQLTIFSTIGLFMFTSAIIGLGISGVSLFDMHLINKDNHYKKYCESYTVLKEGKSNVFKILMKNGKTIYLHEEYEKNDLEYELDLINQHQIEISNQRPFKQEEPIPKLHLENLIEQKQNFNKAIGREKEIQILKESLVMDSVSPIVVGPAGVGKTALVYGLIYDIQLGNVPNELKNRKIYSVDVSDIVANSKYVGVFEQKMKNLIERVKKENAILFIDEFHTIMGAGQGSVGILDGANILKPYLSSGEIKIIGVTTQDEYDEWIKKDKAFSRRFEIIKIDEPENHILYNIVDAHIEGYEEKYKIKFTKNNIEKKAVIDSLIELTGKSHRRQDSDMKNPSLILYIIERSFAKARVNKLDCVTIKNICETVESNQNIWESAKNRTIDEIKNIDGYEYEEERGKCKIIQINKNYINEKR